MSNLDFSAYVWFVARVDNGKEFVNAYEMTCEGYVCVAPSRKIVKRRSRHSKATVQVSVPLLPGYMFVGFKVGSDRSWEKARQRRLINGVLRVDNGEGPVDAAIMATEVERFHSLSGSVQFRTENRQEFPKGARVVVLEGILTGLRGRVINVHGDAVHIEVEDSGALSKVDVPFTGVALAA